MLAQKKYLLFLLSNYLKYYYRVKVKHNVVMQTNLISLFFFVPRWESVSCVSPDRSCDCVYTRISGSGEETEDSADKATYRRVCKPF